LAQIYASAGSECRCPGKWEWLLAAVTVSSPEKPDTTPKHRKTPGAYHKGVYP